jgi:hypothetical protein
MRAGQPISVEILLLSVSPWLHPVAWKLYWMQNQHFQGD